MSIRSRPRFERRLEKMSMRMCSFAFRVQEAQSMKTAPNRYHCSSSQAFDEVPNTLRMIALMAETSTATTIAQAVILPMRSFSESMTRLIPRSPDTRAPLELGPALRKGAWLACSCGISQLCGVSP